MIRGRLRRRRRDGDPAREPDAYIEIDPGQLSGIFAVPQNGILQQLVQPLAMGAALGIHPLAVLIVTIAGGALFGAVGLILAAPLTSAAVRITADLARARAEEARPVPAPGAPAEAT